MEYYSATKRNQFLIHIATGINLKIGERSQNKKVTNFDFMYDLLEKAKLQNYRDKNQSVADQQGWECREMNEKGTGNLLGWRHLGSSIS